MYSSQTSYINNGNLNCLHAQFLKKLTHAIMIEVWLKWMILYLNQIHLPWHESENKIIKKNSWLIKKLIDE